MHCMDGHERYMRRAIELAANVPEFPFGAISDKNAGPFKLEIEFFEG